MSHATTGVLCRLPLPFRQAHLCVAYWQPHHVLPLSDVWNAEHPCSVGQAVAGQILIWWKPVTVHFFERRTVSSSQCCNPAGRCPRVVRGREVVKVGKAWVGSTL